MHGIIYRAYWAVSMIVCKSFYDVKESRIWTTYGISRTADRLNPIIIGNSLHQFKSALFLGTAPYHTAGRLPMTCVTASRPPTSTPCDVPPKPITPE